VSKHKRTWYVYLLECADGTLYTGTSVDPERRLQQHNAGRGARYTQTRRPVRLLGSVAVCGRGEALRLEKRVKRWRPQRKRAFFLRAEQEGE
jgi:putative endonuclease